MPEFLLRLWNVYSFFVIYANIDGFDPAKEIGTGRGQGPIGARPKFAAARTIRPPQSAASWIAGFSAN